MLPPFTHTAMLKDPKTGLIIAQIVFHSSWKIWFFSKDRDSDGKTEDTESSLIQHYSKAVSHNLITKMGAYHLTIICSTLKGHHALSMNAIFWTFFDPLLNLVHFDPSFHPTRVMLNVWPLKELRCIKNTFLKPTVGPSIYFLSSFWCNFMASSRE